MKISSVFVSSAIVEGFGNAIIEAMSADLPIIAVDCPGGPREILEDGKWGALLPIDDEAAMINAIEKVFSEERKISTKKRADDFSLETISKKYLNLIFKK